MLCYSPGLTLPCFVDSSLSVPGWMPGSRREGPAQAVPAWPRLLAPVPGPDGRAVSGCSCLCRLRFSRSAESGSLTPRTAARQGGSCVSLPLPCSPRGKSLSPLCVRKEGFKYLHIVGSAGSPLTCRVFSTRGDSGIPLAAVCRLLTAVASRAVGLRLRACGHRCCGVAFVTVVYVALVLCVWLWCCGVWPRCCGVWPRCCVCGFCGCGVRGFGVVVCGPGVVVCGLRWVWCVALVAVLCGPGGCGVWAQSLGHTGSPALRRVGSSWARDQPGVLCFARWILNHWTIRKGSRSVVSDSLRPYGLSRQAPLSMELSRQESWSGLPFPSPGDLPDQRIEPRSPTLQADALTSETPGKPKMFISWCIKLCRKQLL